MAIIQVKNYNRYNSDIIENNANNREYIIQFIIQFRRFGQFWDDDIIENNCNNSDISCISKIIALLFHLCNLYHYYFYSGVGPGALLQREHVITLLYHYYARLNSIIL